jgi:drug/metabolite transporter (DMT)-like permease
MAWSDPEPLLVRGATFVMIGLVCALPIMALVSSFSKDEKTLARSMLGVAATIVGVALIIVGSLEDSTSLQTVALGIGSSLVGAGAVLALAEL